MNVVKHLKLANPYEVGYDINYYFRDCHDHDFYEILFVLSGNAVHCVNDAIQILKPGDLIYIRPSDTHYLTPYGGAKEKYEFFNIHISCKHMETQFAYSGELKNKIDEPSLPLIVNLGTSELIYLAKKMKRLNSMVFSETRTFLYYSILKDMLWHALASGTVVTKTYMPNWFEDFLMIISKTDVFTLKHSEITKLSNVSESYLWKIFKKYMNMTPTEYVNSLKLEYSYELIAGTTYTLEEISRTAGFNSYSYFYKKFLEKYGVSPKEIRKSKQ